MRTTKKSGKVASRLATPIPKARRKHPGVSNARRMPMRKSEVLTSANETVRPLPHKHSAQQLLKHYEFAEQLVDAYFAHGCNMQRAVMAFEHYVVDLPSLTGDLPYLFSGHDFTGIVIGHGDADRELRWIITGMYYSRYESRRDKNITGHTVNSDGTKTARINISEERVAEILGNCKPFMRYVLELIEVYSAPEELHSILAKLVIEHPEKYHAKGLMLALQSMRDKRLAQDLLGLHGLVSGSEKEVWLTR